MNLTSDVIIDSSVWIEFFRYGNGEICDLVDELLESNGAALCGIVEMEILQGVRKKEQKLISDLFSALKYYELKRIDFINAGNQLNILRKKGITIPSTDSLIGTLCQRNNLVLLTLDNHFDHLEKVKKYQF